MRSNTAALAFALSALVFACSGNSTSEPDGEVADETSLDEPEQAASPMTPPVSEDDGDDDPRIALRPTNPHQ